MVHPPQDQLAVNGVGVVEGPCGGVPKAFPDESRKRSLKTVRMRYIKDSFYLLIASVFIFYLHLTLQTNRAAAVGGAVKTRRRL